MAPQYGLEEIKSGTDEKTWARAVALYEAGKVSEVEESYVGFTARVLGTQPYDTAVSDVCFNQGHCSCFVGRTGAACKHMIALAIWAVRRGLPPEKK